MSSVVSAGFPFVVKVEVLPPLWRGNVVFGEAQCGICCHVLCLPGSSVGFYTLGVDFF